MLYANENIWLPQKRMADLFGCSVGNISLHLKKIYKENELDESATIEDYSIVQIANENIWLPRKRIAKQFDVDHSVVTRHLKNIYSDNEVQEDSVCASIAHTA